MLLKDCIIVGNVDLFSYKNNHHCDATHWFVDYHFEALSLAFGL